MQLGPIPPPAPPMPAYAQGRVILLRNLQNLEFSEPLFMSSNLGFIRDMEVVNLNETNELEVVVTSIVPESEYTSDPYRSFTGNYNNASPKAIILHNHSYQDTINSSEIVFLDSTRLGLGLTSGDIDMDGDVDILLGTLVSGKIGVFTNEGDLNLALSDSITPQNGRVLKIQMEDINQDGFPDIFYAGNVSGGSSHLSQILNAGGNFEANHTRIDSASTGFYSFYEIAYYDVNSDNFPDIVINKNGINYFENLGNGLFSDILTPLQPSVNGDGSIVLHSGSGIEQNDLISWGYSPYNESVGFYLYNDVIEGSSLSYELLNPTDFLTFKFILSNDYDSDGKQDFLVGTKRNPTFQIVTADEDFQFIQNRILNFDLLPANSVVSDDFNADGNLDIAYNHEGITSELIVTLNDGNGYFTDTSHYNTSSSSSNSLVNVDFNQDGFVDILVSTQSVSNRPSLGILFNTAGDGFLPMQILNDTNSYSSAKTAIADWDEDGFPDVFILAQSSLVFYKNINGLSLAAPDTIVHNCLNCNRMKAADLDLDGKTDITYSTRISSTNNSNIIALMNETGSNYTSIELVPYTAFLIHHYDFDDINADGFLDIITFLSDSSRMAYSILGPESTGEFTTICDIERDPLIFGIADINQDGAKDIYGYLARREKIWWIMKDNGGETYINSQNNDVVIYPNPASENISILLPENEAKAVKFEFIDLSGRIIRSQANENSGIINISGLSVGLYICRITCEDGCVYSKKLIIE
jgi:hypothetical protein